MDQYPPRRVAFRSISLLGQYDLSEKYDETYLKEVILYGMRTHFKNPSKGVKVWYEVDPLGIHADVHMEMVASSGEVLQPWVLSLCREPIEEWEAFKTPCFNFEDSPEPFLADGDFLWPCPDLTHEEIVKGIEAWAAWYWPDWSPIFVQEKMQHLSFMEELEDNFTSLYVLSPVEALSPEVHAYLFEEGFLVVAEEEEGLVVHTSHMQIERLNVRYPSVSSQIFLPSERV